MKKLVLRNLDFSADNMLSAEEKTKVLGGGDKPRCRCIDGTSIVWEKEERCPCWCLPCDWPK